MENIMDTAICYKNDHYQTKFPPYYEVFDTIIRYLQENKVISALFLDCSDMGNIEPLHGKKIYNDFLDYLDNIIQNMYGNHIRKEDIITTNHPSDEQFFIFLSYKRTDRKFHAEGLGMMAERIYNYINQELAQKAYKVIKNNPKIYVGHAIILHNPLIKTEKLISKLMDDSKRMAEYQKFQSIMRNREKVQELIIKEEITTVYQPIINLNDCSMIGYEALTRGPEGTIYENPYVLFEVAKETGLSFELDRLCRRHAFINAKRLPDGLNIFVNCLPSSIHDPEFKGAYLNDLLKQAELGPSNVVLEITEREAIDNYQNFKNAIGYYSNLGFAIAVDDAGAGYSCLEALLEINPDFIKVDISLVQDVSLNALKQEMIRALVNVAKNMKTIIIAEGIENNEDFRCLLDIGVNFGQGFLFAKPAFPFPPINFIKEG